MLICAHKDLLLRLAREHTRGVRHSLQLARAQLGPSHHTVRTLMKNVVEAEQAEMALESEPARQVA